MACWASAVRHQVTQPAFQGRVELHGEAQGGGRQFRQSPFQAPVDDQSCCCFYCSAEVQQKTVRQADETQFQAESKIRFSKLNR